MCLDIYKQITISQIPRILGLGDRNQKSKTFGCFDRYYWHYKLLDISNARFQETALILALLYQNDFNGNIYFKRNSMYQWVLGAIEFWAKIQRSDGSFDELYPHEHCYCSTAFSTYAITESMLILDSKSCMKNVIKAGNWLSRNENLRVTNQMIASVLALYNIYLLTGEEKFQQAANSKKEKVLDLQTSEGVFLEYGGYDIGYLSICISYFAKYYRKTNNQGVYDSLNKAIKFIEGKIHNDGGYDYSKTSRGTQYLYPHGFVIIDRMNVINKHIKGLKKNCIINPPWMDDRYCISLTIDYLQTYLEIPNENDNI